MTPLWIAIIAFVVGAVVASTYFYFHQHASVAARYAEVEQQEGSFLEMRHLLDEIHTDQIARFVRAEREALLAIDAGDLQSASRTLQQSLADIYGEQASLSVEPRLLNELRDELRQLVDASETSDTFLPIVSGELVTMTGRYTRPTKAVEPTGSATIRR